MTHDTYSSSPIAMRWDKDAEKLPSVKLKQEDIVRTVCKAMSVTMTELKSKTRKRSVVYPRQIAMYLMATRTTLSLKGIGQMFGGRDHTTAIHSREMIRGLMSVDERVNHDVNEIIRLLTGHTVISVVKRPKSRVFAEPLKRIASDHTNRSHFGLAG